MKYRPFKYEEFGFKLGKLRSDFNADILNSEVNKAFGWEATVNLEDILDAHLKHTYIRPMRDSLKGIFTQALAW